MDGGRRTEWMYARLTDRVYERCAMPKPPPRRRRHIKKWRMAARGHILLGRSIVKFYLISTHILGHVYPYSTSVLPITCNLTGYADMLFRSKIELPSYLRE